MVGSIEGARAGLTSVTRGTLVMMLGTLGYVAESFVARVVLVRTLNAGLWSQFSYALALAGLASSFGALGLTSALARSLPYESTDRERRRMVHTAYVVGIPAAIASGALLSLVGVPAAVVFRDPVFAETLAFFGVGVTFSVLAGLLASIFQGYEDVVPNALYIQVLNPMLFIGFLLVATTQAPPGWGYFGILVAYAVAAAASLVALLVYSRRRLPRLLPAGPRDPGLSRRLLLFAVPLFLVGVLGYLAGNGDTIILGAFQRSAVGYYAANLSMARLLQIGVGSLGYIFLPVTARFVRTGERGAVRITYVTATKWVLLTSLPIFLVFAFLPVQSLNFVYGAGYATSTLTLEILLVGALVSTLVGPSSVAQVAFGHTRLLFYNTLASAGADVALGLVLVPAWGIVGAAVAWSTGIALLPVLSLIELAAMEGVHPFERHFLLPLTLTAVPVGAFLLLAPIAYPYWALPGIALGAAGLFLLAVVATHSIDDGDRLLLEAVERLLGRRLPFVRWLAAFGRSAP